MSPHPAPAALVLPAALLVHGARRHHARRLRRAAAPPPTVMTDDGVALHAELDGTDGADVTVVLVHGYGARLEEWDRVRPALRPHARLVLVDLRGHGRSSWGSPPRATMEQLAAGLCRVVEAHGGNRPVVLVGHSMGAMAVLALAAARPDLFGTRVVGVGLVSASAGHLRRRGTAALVASLLRRTGRPARPAVDSVVDRVGRRPPVAVRHGRRPAAARPTDARGRRGRPEGRARPRAGQLRAHPPGGARRVCGAAAAPQRAEDALPVLRQLPVLVLAGGADKTIPPWHSVQIAAAIGPQAQLRIVPGAGHLVTLTHPDDVAEHVLQLLADVKQR